MYQTFLDERIGKSFRRYSKANRARVDRVRELFEEKGFNLSEIYLKKITQRIWELRSGPVRLLFGVI